MLNACVLLKIVPTKAETILRKVRAVSGVRKAYLCYGRFDLVVFIEVEDYKELRRATSEINGIEGVRSSETLAEA
ncbi:MAG: Lrp/AsnC ligand binding domain-containing protein [Nitrososphaerota archaeon]|nr:Lrp/AsnC ligand binding domain-containing protein [Candidatus Bathyarchaeota archaeon]MDW8048773.1 Lrp/AsnC ligand binding domain-containing protein [Nitrososphaerota archaeon]